MAKQRFYRVSSRVPSFGGANTAGGGLVRAELAESMPNTGRMLEQRMLTGTGMQQLDPIELDEEHLLACSDPACGDVFFMSEGEYDFHRRAVHEQRGMNRAKQLHDELIRRRARADQLAAAAREAAEAAEAAKAEVAEIEAELEPSLEAHPVSAGQTPKAKR